MIDPDEFDRAIADCDVFYDSNGELQSSSDLPDPVESDDEEDHPRAGLLSPDQLSRLTPIDSSQLAIHPDF